MLKLISRYLFCCLFLPLCLFGQQSAYIIEENSDVNKFSSNKIIIPLTRIGNLFLIDAEVDSIKGKFILDLGAPYLVLNSTYFRNYTQKSGYYSGTLLNGSEFVNRITVTNFNFNGIIFNNLKADVTNLGEIEDQKGTQILGLMGVNLFKDYVIELNPVSQQLILYKEFTEGAINTPLLFKTSTRIENNVIMIYAKIGEKVLNFSLDTGAESNLLSNDLPEKVYRQMKILGVSSITDGNGNSTEVISARLNNLQIEKQTFNMMFTMILSLDNISRAYNKPIDGMLGFPFFSMGRVIFDNKNKTLMMYNFR